jgi:sugar-specific transcriptional regulator TrmB
MNEKMMSNEELKSQLKELAPTKEKLEAQGLPTGNDKQSAKQRLLKLFEEAGVIETLKTPAQQQEFAMQLDQLVDLVLAKKFKEVSNHPLVQMLNQVLPQAQQQAAPTDFAGMMPGGGMNAG